jgi:DNA-binding HxlR family transcriptional regulator
MTKEIDEARVLVLRAMHQLKGVATSAALSSATGLSGRMLNKTIESLSADGWIGRDTETMRALGGVWRMTPARRRARLSEEI